MSSVVDEQSVEKHAMVGTCFPKRPRPAQVVMVLEGTGEKASEQ